MEYFKKYPLHKSVREKFSSTIQNNMLAHAYLFYGPEGTGKEAFALEIAKAINCQDNDVKPCGSCNQCTKINQFKHPDVKYIFPIQSKYKDNEEEIKERFKLKSENPYARVYQTTNANILIDFIRKLKKESIYPPYEAKKKVFIISEAEKMTRESSNSFLKLLEEPPKDLLLILTSSAKNLILDTIQSRCQMIYFNLLKNSELRQIAQKYCNKNDDIESIIRFSMGNLKTFFDNYQTDFLLKKELLLKYLRAIAANNPIDISNIVDELNRTKDKTFLMEILNLLILWFNDVTYLLTFNKYDNIINIDLTEELKKFSMLYKNAEFYNIFEYVDEAKNQISRNLYIPLVFTILALRIKNVIIKEN